MSQYQDKGVGKYRKRWFRRFFINIIFNSDSEYGFTYLKKILPLKYFSKDTSEYRGLWIFVSYNKQEMEIEADQKGAP